jgi:cell division protein FtsZ
VIAAGFDGGMPKRRDSGTVLRREPAPQQSQADTRAATQGGLPSQSGSPLRAPAPVGGAPAGRPTGSSPAAPSRQPERAPAGGPQAGNGYSTIRPSESTTPAAQPARQPRQPQFDDDDLDVPDFLK